MGIIRALLSEGIKSPNRLLPTDRFARTASSRVEYIKVDERQPVRQALEALRAEGYTISEDTLHRFGEFGISSICDGSRYYLARKAVDDIRYVREVERKYRLERDRDGLALELAYRGYHTIPWERVHNSARKRVEMVQNTINRGLYRANDWASGGFPLRRIPHLAEQLTSWLIPKNKEPHSPRQLAEREMVRKVLSMALRVVYTDQVFAAHDLRKLLMDTGLPEELALKTSSEENMNALNTLCPFLRMAFDNVFRLTLAAGAPIAEVQATVQTMRAARQTSLTLVRKAGLSVKDELLFVEDYPTIEPGGAKTDFMSHNLYYAVVLLIGRKPEAAEKLTGAIAGNDDSLENVFESVATLKSLVARLIELTYEHA
ncbi:MAG TPA: hypothetical protein VKR56_15875 [Candidatus Cybelea sp.]|nr:hypothetical protein [Candidatus Cybelea sp.]